MRLRTPTPAPPRPLTALAAHLSPDTIRGAVPDVMVRGISADSRVVEPGDLFVARRGVAADGHRFVLDAAERGAAVAMVDEGFAGEVRIPLLRVRDAGRALAEVAAAWHGHPAGAMRRVGITGTMGKTSVLSFLERILATAGIPAGSIGSLGIRCGEAVVEETGHTVPGPLHLHEGLRALVEGGCEVAVMEATSHALTQERLHGVEFDLGVFTGLVPLEHMEYHESFRDYAEAKLRYFDHLRPGAPLVAFADDPVLRGVTLGRDVRPIAVGTDPHSTVHLDVRGLAADGTEIRIAAPAGVRRVDGGVSPPLDLAVRLPLVGRSSAVNVALATAAAASLGAEGGAIREALATLSAAPRRMQVVQTEPFLLLDDYGGHPNTVTAVFEVVRALPWRRLHVIAAPRGMRGEEINRAVGGALGVWLREVGFDTLCVALGEDTADDRNRTLPEDRAGFEAGLAGAGITAPVEPRVAGVLERVVPHVEAGDLLLVLGAQCMDGVAARAVEMWGRRTGTGGPARAARHPLPA